jgi:hypothetical protein
MQEGQVMSSSTTTEVLINSEKAKDEASDVTTCPHDEDMEYLLACVFDCSSTSTLSFLNQHFIFGYLKTFDASSVISIISSIISF